MGSQILSWEQVSLGIRKSEIWNIEGESGELQDHLEFFLEPVTSREEQKNPIPGKQVLQIQMV